MWKYIKGTEKDFENYPEDSEMVVRIQNINLSVKTTNRGVFNCLDIKQGWCKSGIQDMDFLHIIAQREWVKESGGETPLPTKDQINVADAMEQSSTPRIGSMMNPAKDLPKIKLDVKKPVFNINDDKEVKFIYSNKREYVFEDHQGLILVTMNEYLDSNYYNKPDVKTTEQLISDAWTHACNDGSLWASPTQLYYIAIKELIKHGVIDVSKTHEVSDDTNK